MFLYIPTAIFGFTLKQLLFELLRIIEKGNGGYRRMYFVVNQAGRTLKSVRS
jgi:hypothetical protein